MLNWKYVAKYVGCLTTKFKPANTEYDPFGGNVLGNLGEFGS